MNNNTEACDADKDIARFWGKVDKSGDCWVWTASLQGRGYGSFSAQGRRHQAHRWIFQRINGSVPADIDICHQCDNPRCVRPSHLFSGSRSVNMRDCAHKGRNGMQTMPFKSSLIGNSITRPRGEAQGSAKLTADKIRQIKHLSLSGMSSAEIAPIFGIHAGHVRKILTKRAWSHV